ncbi:MAG: LPXTG cell wall anchor domain-containing protein, partial [Dehalococcoidia bacterium]
YILMSNRDMYDRLSKFLPQGFSPTVVMLGLVIGVPPVWVLLGAIAGLASRLVDDSFPNAGLGSPNFVFTVAILCLAALATLILLLIRKRLIWLGLLINIAFAGIFGWLLPLLANWR